LNDEILTEYESFYELRSQNLHMIQKFPQTFKKDVDHLVSTMIPQPFTLDSNELWSKLQRCVDWKNLSHEGSFGLPPLMTFVGFPDLSPENVPRKQLLLLPNLLITNSKIPQSVYEGFK
jgi:hypothetical protein